MWNQVNFTRRVAALALLLTLASGVGAVVPAAADPSPAANISFESLGAGGGFSGGTMTAGPDGVVGNADDGDPHALGWAGILTSTVANSVDPDARTSLYCIDLLTGIGIGDVQTAGSWATAAGTNPANGNTNTLTPANIARIAAVVANNYPNPDSLVPLSGTANDKALAVQWAVWHYANGYEPGGAVASIDLGAFGSFATTPDTVVANYAAIVGAIDSGSYGDVLEPELPRLEIVPPTAPVGVAAGRPAGPFTVDATSGVDVALSASDGASIVDEDGNPVSGPFHDGDQVWVAHASLGTVTVSGSAAIVLPIGSTMVDANFQRLVNAAEVLANFTSSTTAEFVAPASLGDVVWEDTDQDGLQDESEPNVGGVAVALLDGSGNQIATTQTADDGSYLFDGLVPGTYTVIFTAPSGYVVTQTSAGDDDSIDSNGLTSSTTLEAGQHDPTQDLGVYRAPVPTTTTAAPTTTTTAPAQAANAGAEATTTTAVANAANAAATPTTVAQTRATPSGPSGALAFTGGHGAALVTIASILLLSGGLAMAWSRRRRCENV